MLECRALPALYNRPTRGGACEPITIEAKRRRKTFSMSVRTILAAALSVACAIHPVPAPAAESFVNILTGATGGVYYALGETLGAAMRKALPGTKISVQATRGSNENLSLLESGRGEIGFALGDSLTNAWNGNDEGGFKTPHKKLRGIAALFPNYIQIVARADSGIRTLDDLKGKRISVGATRSNTELNAQAILKASGLGFKDFARVDHSPFGESIELLKERQIDAMLQSAPLGVLALRDLAAVVAIVVVPIPADVVRKINDPTYLAAVIPASTYPGQAAEVPAVAVENYLVTHEDVPDEIVYATTKALWTNADALKAAHSAAKLIDPARALEGMPVPLHPGAERYYKEAGLIR